MNNSRRKRIKESTLMLVGALERLRKIYAAERDEQVADSLKEAISGLEDTIKTLSDAGFCEPVTKQPTKSRGYDSALDPNSKKIVALATAFGVLARNRKREEEERKQDQSWRDSRDWQEAARRGNSEEEDDSNNW